MPTISVQKKDKISEQILHYLFSISPEPAFTNAIAKEIARDEEFTKYLLSELSKKSLVSEVKKNKSGIEYIRRQRWILSNEAYQAYKRQQGKSQTF